MIVSGEDTIRSGERNIELDEEEFLNCKKCPRSFYTKIGFENHINWIDIYYDPLLQRYFLITQKLSHEIKHPPKPASNILVGTKSWATDARIQNKDNESKFLKKTII